MAELTLLTDDHHTQRYPLPPFPSGWYGLLRSDELGKGEPVPLTVLGRELVAFRDAQGRARVVNAFCPHYGAHLGHEGKVRDGVLECPFHGWRFDGEGRCVHAPFAKKAPRVGVRSFHVVERNRIIFMWFHARGEPPSYEIPEVPELSSRRFRRFRGYRYSARTHVQELRENIVDEAHFQHIHGQPEPPRQELSFDGPFGHLKQTMVLSLGVEVDFRALMVGPGVMIVHTSAPFEHVSVALTTPIDAERSDMRLLYSVKNPLGSRVLGRLLEMLYKHLSEKEVALEATIWEHKTYIQRPVFLPHERGISKLRKWYTQFYDGAALSVTAQEPGAPL